GQALPAGWTGKVWAMQQGLAHVDAGGDQPDYLLFTDADIEYALDALRRLVSRAEQDDLVMTSIMAKLNCESVAERALIPAFVFFFQMLYPFSWVNRRTAKTAAAAGGCMLVDGRAFERAGGLGKIRGAMIDDCALAALLKKEGPIWVGLSNHVRSLRAYPRFGDIRRMVARSAYAQLRFSPFLLITTIFAMIFAYLTPPFFALNRNFLRPRGVDLDGSRLPAHTPLLSHFPVMGRDVTRDRGSLCGVHSRFGVSALAGQRRTMEGAQSGACSQAMTAAFSIEASKTEHGENFPVASFLIIPRLRKPILSFYRFARAADDIADHPKLSEQDKFAVLAALEDTLLGKSNSAKAAIPLRQVLAETGFAPTHPLDL